MRPASTFLVIQLSNSRFRILYEAGIKKIILIILALQSALRYIHIIKCCFPHCFWRGNSI